MRTSFRASVLLRQRFPAATVPRFILEKPATSPYNADVLDKLQSGQSQVRVAIVGMGAMGKGLLYQSTVTAGLRCVAIADIRIEKAIQCAQWLKLDHKVVRNLEEMDEAVRRGLLAVCEDGELAARCELVDVLVEASSAIGAAAKFAVTALRHRKHLVLMNAEIDLLFGPHLLRLARENEAIYTSCDGDQHGVIKRLVDEIQAWGFELVMGGNIKGFLDRYSNPTKIVPEADKRNLDYRMATGYTDGTKLCMEMALIANALGLRTLVPGMRGPRARSVQEVFQLFDLAELWRDRRPFVDYLLGAEPGGGVFAIGYCDNPYQQEMMTYYKMGTGPFYLFYRPYHLCHVEAMRCITDAARGGPALLQPACGFRTNVIAYAKRELKQGEALDGIGGYTCYGLIENCAGNDGLPIGLSEKLTLRRNIAKDERITLSDVKHDPRSFEFELYFKSLKDLAP